MNELRLMPVNEQVGLLFVALFGVLTLASVLVLWLSLREDGRSDGYLLHRQERKMQTLRDLRAVFNAVYVSRERGAEQDPLEPLIEALKNGDSLILFPEGTRSNKGEPMPFKSGLFHLAEQFPDVQLVPAWIDNVQRVMPKGEVVPVPILCTVTFGAPMHLGEGEDKREFLERAREAVLGLRPRVS